MNENAGQAARAALPRPPGATAGDGHGDQPGPNDPADAHWTRWFGGSTRTDVLPLVIPAIAGVAYLFGTVSVSAFSAELGVAPRDLGVDFRDYVILAIANLAAIAVVIGATVGFTFYLMRAWGWFRKPGATYSALVVFAVAVSIVLALAVFAYSIVLVRDVNINVGTYVFAVLLSIPLALTARPPTWLKPYRKPAELAVGGVLGGVLLLNAMWTGESWGVELRVWAEDCQDADTPCTSPPHGPAGLTLLFEPAVGTVFAGGESACVVRVGQHVYLGTQSVVVVEPGQFEKLDCTVQDRPLVPETGLVEVYGLAAAGVEDVADGTVVTLVSFDDTLLRLEVEGQVVVVDRASVTIVYLPGKHFEVPVAKVSAPT